MWVKPWPQSVEGLFPAWTLRLDLALEDLVARPLCLCLVVVVEGLARHHAAWDLEALVV